MTSDLDKIRWKSQINGIPCTIRVDSFVKGYPPILTGAMEDADPGCPDELEFTVLDSRNIIAPWITKQMTDRDEDRIYEEFYVTLLEIKHCYEE